MNTPSKPGQQFYAARILRNHANTLERMLDTFSPPQRRERLRQILECRQAADRIERPTN